MKHINIGIDGIESHVDTFFMERDSPWRFRDLLRLQQYRVGEKGLTIKQQADELGVSRTTLYKWIKFLR